LILFSFSLDLQILGGILTLVIFIGLIGFGVSVGKDDVVEYSVLLDDVFRHSNDVGIGGALIRV